MANVTINMPTELLEKLSRLGDKQDEISARVLEAGAAVLETKMHSALSGVIGKSTKHKSQSTGELLKSLGTSPVLIDRNGNSNIKVGFSEPHSGGESNAKLASILEYGKHGQPPKPFMKQTKSAAKKPVQSAMKAKLEEELSKV